MLDQGKLRGRTCARFSAGLVPAGADATPALLVVPVLVPVPLLVVLALGPCVGEADSSSRGAWVRVGAMV